MSSGKGLRLAHRVDDPDIVRTADVIDVSGDEIKANFEDFHLRPEVEAGLKAAGFVRPSPIQAAAVGPAKIGLDLLVQAKSGTGKTLVYAITALNMVNVESPKVQVLVLCPTREIAVQGARTLLDVARTKMPSFKATTLIGGLSVKDDPAKLQKCHAVVGTPGRIKQLIDEETLKLDGVRLFCLDEADKLMESSFKGDVTYIYNRLSSKKQILSLSATYKEDICKSLSSMMRNPRHIRLASSNQVLVGLDHYCLNIDFHPNPRYQLDFKVNGILKVLGAISFNQALVFTNYSLTAESVCSKLNASGWPAIFIAAQLQDQHERLAAFNSLRQFTSRILVTTDLSARGIDAANVNLVVNLDVPWDSRTFLHRSGRAGRYGTRGVNVSLVPREGQDMANLQKTIFRTGTKIKVIKEGQEIPDLWKVSGDETKGWEVLEGLECQLEDEDEEDWKGKKEKERPQQSQKTKAKKAKKLKEKKPEVETEPGFESYLENNNYEHYYTEEGDDYDYDYEEDDGLDFYEGSGEGNIGEWVTVAESAQCDESGDRYQSSILPNEFIIDSYRAVTGYPKAIEEPLTLEKAKEILTSFKKETDDSFQALTIDECDNLANELFHDLEGQLKQRIKAKDTQEAQIDHGLAVKAMAVILSDEESKWNERVQDSHEKFRKSGLSVKDAIDYVLENGCLPEAAAGEVIKELTEEKSSVALAESESSEVSHESPMIGKDRPVVPDHVGLPDFPVYEDEEEVEEEYYPTEYDMPGPSADSATGIFPDPDSGLEKYLSPLDSKGQAVMEQFKEWMKKVETNKKMIELQEFQHQMAKLEIQYGRKFK